MVQPSPKKAKLEETKKLKFGRGGKVPIYGDAVKHRPISTFQHCIILTTPKNGRRNGRSTSARRR
jgi:hypothetical protein